MFCPKCGSILLPRKEGSKNILVCSCGYKSGNIEKMKITETISKKEKEVNFKFESCIIHIACKNVESMKLIFEKAKLAGWKNIGAISFKERFILDLRSTEKIEFPILRGGEIIVDDDFLKIIVKEANEKLRIGWEKIKRLEKNV